MLDSTDIGHRVVVRARVDGPGPRPLFRDHLGVLTALTPAAATLRTRGGPVTVPRDRIHRARRVPPPPARRGAG